MLRECRVQRVEVEVEHLEGVKVGGAHVERVQVVRAVRPGPYGYQPVLGPAQVNIIFHQYIYFKLFMKRPTVWK